MLVNTSNYNEGVQKTMTNITKRSLVAAGVLAALMAGNVALAADVPAGVTLAEKQTLVRNNGSEVQSLDPHKIEGVPESNISRDLFEGLLVSDLDGHPAPGVAESWDNKDAKVPENLRGGLVADSRALQLDELQGVANSHGVVSGFLGCAERGNRLAAQMLNNATRRSI